GDHARGLSNAEGDRGRGGGYGQSLDALELQDVLELGMPAWIGRCLGHGYHETLASSLADANAGANICSLPFACGRVRARPARRAAHGRAGGSCAARLGISAISDGRPSSQPIWRRRPRNSRAAGSDRRERALSLRPQPDVSRAPDFHAGLGVDVCLVVRAGAVRRSRGLVSSPRARGRGSPSSDVWCALPRLSAAGEALDPRSLVTGCRDVFVWSAAEGCSHVNEKMPEHSGCSHLAPLSFLSPSPVAAAALARPKPMWPQPY